MKVKIGEVGVRVWRCEEENDNIQLDAWTISSSMELVVLPMVVVGACDRGGRTMR